MKLGVFRRQNRGFVEFGNGLGVFVFLEVQSTESRMRNRVDWIYFDLLLESLCGIGVILLLLKREPQIVVNVLVVRIQFNLLSERCACIVKLSQPQICQTKIVPALFVFGVQFKRTLQKRNSRLQISGVECGKAGFEKFAGLRGFRNLRRSGSGILGEQSLAFIRFYGASEREVIAHARRRQLPHLEVQSTLGHERVSFKAVA